MSTSTKHFLVCWFKLALFFLVMIICKSVEIDPESYFLKISLYDYDFSLFDHKTAIVELRNNNNEILCSKKVDDFINREIYCAVGPSYLKHGYNVVTATFFDSVSGESLDKIDLLIEATPSKPIVTTDNKRFLSAYRTPVVAGSFGIGIVTGLAIRTYILPKLNSNPDSEDEDCLDNDSVSGDRPSGRPPNKYRNMNPRSLVPFDFGKMKNSFFPSSPLVRIVDVSSLSSDSLKRNDELRSDVSRGIALDDIEEFKLYLERKIAEIKLNQVHLLQKYEQHVKPQISSFRNASLDYNQTTLSDDIRIGIPNPYDQSSNDVATKLIGTDFNQELDILAPEIESNASDTLSTHVSSQVGTDIRSKIALISAETNGLSRIGLFRKVLIFAALVTLTVASMLNRSAQQNHFNEDKMESRIRAKVSTGTVNGRHSFV